MDLICWNRKQAVLCWVIPSLALRLCFATNPQFGQQDVPVSFECANPLFRGHWFSPRTDAPHLGKQPIAYDDLVRCKMWNKHASCCNPSMEAPQQRAFESRLAEFEQWAILFQEYKADLQKIRSSSVYRHVIEVERALLDRVLTSFGQVHGHMEKCKKALMLFSAGIICWGCDPHWNKYVRRRSDGSVSSVNVALETCIYVDQRCGDFGALVVQLMNEVMDSQLAKMTVVPLPNLAMLSNRESICPWLRTTLAMQPLPIIVPTDIFSNEEDVAVRRLQIVQNASQQLSPTRELVSGATDSQVPANGIQDTGVPSWAAQLLPETTTTLPPRTLGPTPAPLPAPPGYHTEPELALDPIYLGKQSGFHFEKDAPAPISPGSLFG